MKRVTKKDRIRNRVILICSIVLALIVVGCLIYFLR